MFDLDLELTLAQAVCFSAIFSLSLALFCDLISSNSTFPSDFLLVVTAELFNSSASDDFDECNNLIEPVGGNLFTLATELCVTLLRNFTGFPSDFFLQLAFALPLAILEGYSIILAQSSMNYLNENHGFCLVKCFGCLLVKNNSKQMPLMPEMTYAIRLIGLLILGAGWPGKNSMCHSSKIHLIPLNVTFLLK